MLKEKLESMVAQSASKVPTEAKEIMALATQSVQESIASRNIPSVGSTLPAFALPNSQGQVISSADMIGEGPLVLSFFRGVW